MKAQKGRTVFQITFSLSQMANSHDPSILIKKQPAGLCTLLPAWHWLAHYPREYFVGDMLAGFIVAVMLVPQGMAYALLAGLPPEV